MRYWAFSFFMLCATNLQAQVLSDKYFGGFAGLSYSANVGSLTKTSLATVDVEYDLGAGYILGAAVGGRLTDNLRLELEVSHTAVRGDGGDFTGVSAFPVLFSWQHGALQCL